MHMGSAEENGTVNFEKFGNYNQYTSGIDESDEGVKGDDKATEGTKANENLITDSVSVGALGASPRGPTKGKGLRKWRRIKREVVRDVSGSVDSAKALKRGLSVSVPIPTRPRGGLSFNTRQKKDGSLSSADAIIGNLGGEANGGFDPKFVVGPTSAQPLDSKNSEDQSSISSTAAHRVASMVTNGIQRGHQGKAWTSSNKTRGERKKILKENSQSSKGSYSQSSNSVFVQEGGSMVSNGRLQGKPANHAGESSDDEARDGEVDLGDRFEAGTSKVNGVEFGDLGHEDLMGVKNQSLPRNIDPLTESISQLQSAQEALEKEIQKLREMGDESQGTTNQEVHEVGTSALFNPGETTVLSSNFFSKNVHTLKQDVGTSESKLEDASAVLKAREPMFSKVEYEEIEAEIEDLFKQKLEAEFESLAISKAIRTLRTDEVDQIAETQDLNLETCNEDSVDSVETELQIPRLQKRVSKVTLYLFIQLILLSVVFVSIVLQLSPHHDGVVPT